MHNLVYTKLKLFPNKIAFLTESCSKKILPSSVPPFFSFLGVAILLLVLPVILFGLMASPESPIVEPPRSEKSKRMQSPYSHPDEFNKAFADMRGLNHGYEGRPTQLQDGGIPARP